MADPQHGTDAEVREAQRFWGDLFEADKSCTELLDRLLTAIAKYISTNFHPCDHSDVAPAQLAAFYRAVGGNYDALFLDTEPSALAFVYERLGCLHSLQPAPSGAGYARPETPALKPRGFTRWQSIQILLMPEEHVPFMQNALQRFEIIDPRTGTAFPKILPKNSFPEKPDEDLVKWYEEVSRKLKETGEQGGRFRVPEAREDGRFWGQSASDIQNDSGDFSNPAFQDRFNRPTAVRRSSRMGPRTPVEFLQDHGRAVVSTVRHLWNPRLTAPAPSHHVRRRSWHNSGDLDDEEFEGLSIAERHRISRRERDLRGMHNRDSIPDYVEDDNANRPTRTSSHRKPWRHGSQNQSLSPRPSRRPPGYSSPRKGRGNVREMSPSRREYFPSSPDDCYDRREPRRQSPAHTPPNAAGGFRPSRAAPFAAQMAHLQTGRTRSGGEPLAEAQGHRSSTSSRVPMMTSASHARNRSDEPPGPKIMVSRRQTGRVGRGSESGSRSRSSGREGLRELNRRSRSTDARMPDDEWFGAESPTGDRNLELENESDIGRNRDRERYRRRDKYVEGVDGRRYPERTWT